MEAYDIGYAIGSYIPFLFILAGFVVLIYLLNKRSKDKKNETFEDRDN